MADFQRALYFVVPAWDAYRALNEIDRTAVDRLVDFLRRTPEDGIDPKYLYDTDPDRWLYERDDWEIVSRIDVEAQGAIVEIFAFARNLRDRGTD